jgi:hypothetical protein
MLICQLISGFTQSEENWNGVQELREKLLSELDDYSTLAVRIRLDNWNADWKAIARQYYMLRERYRMDPPFVVIAFAYSWGVGNGLVKFAKYLDRYGIDIEIAVVSDPIYRHWFSLGNWRVALGDTRIALPANVRLIEGFYQTVNKPMGRQPVSEVSPCKPWTKLRLPHQEMDDAWEWPGRCIEVAKEFTARAVGNPRNVPDTAPPSVAVEERKEA